MNNISINELFDIESLWFGALFEGLEHPWEALKLIAEYIRTCSKASFVELTDGVFVGKDVKLHSTAVINAPCIIGDGTEIRPSAYIRGGVITGRSCVIGNSTELKNCILMDRVQLPHYNYVGDSVLGNHTHMGAGSICSNLKSNGTNVVIHSNEEIETNLRKLGAILGDGADVGCNCVLNPGTVIGRNTTVYPLTSVRGVVPANSIVKATDIIVKKM